MSTSHHLGELKENIIRNLSDDLLSKDWLARKKLLPSCDPTFGHCYLATEAAYHILGGKKNGWKPMYLKCKDGSHWFLLHSSGYIFDVTEEQFEGEVIPYHNAVGKGFLTKKPSKRAMKLIVQIYKNWPRLDGTIYENYIKGNWHGSLDRSHSRRASDRFKIR